MSRILILRDPRTTLTHHGDYMEVKNPSNSYIVAYRHVKALYINKAIKLDIAHLYAISTKADTYLIDKHGYILAKLQQVTKDETL